VDDLGVRSDETSAQQRCDAWTESYPGLVIDVDDIRMRWQQVAVHLDERGRRLFAANEALAWHYGGVTATAEATGLARRTINRGMRELRSSRSEIAGPDPPAPVGGARARWRTSRICRRRLRR
jgi:hypothetical protein